MCIDLDNKIDNYLKFYLEYFLKLYLPILEIYLIKSKILTTFSHLNICTRYID